ncbi:PREDICTED: nucleosome assembly protein 1;3-like isoform X2 [Lupinus angustifolius]|uniref:nucleosome assembly protein 1;3-like isoform X2 n=1 Tax=Lupinus angustifolius TaxID=3871 RepID=UPI00092E20F3|nr:PREDICTED: nucleosome assembly protein 1;3-like isoform X2 [Lupinus angustifolius]
MSNAFNVSDLTAALNEENRADIVNALKSKIQSLAGQHSDILESLSPIVRKRVEFLREIQGQHDEIEAKFFEERAAIEAKYQKLYQPLYTKRCEIVNGVTEVEGAVNETKADAEEDTEKGVPGFWLTAMKNNEVLAEEISERDEAALNFLKDIKWSRIENPKGFKLEFFFDSNPYFSNSVLTKTYHMIDEDEPILEKAIGTEIQWLPGKCLTQKVLKKKPKKGSKNAKPITKTENCESFFNFFNPPEVPDEDDDDIDEEMAEELQNQMEQDYDIGSTIRDKIIPHAVSWFTGDAIQGEEFDLDDDEDDDVEEYDDEEEEEDEEDDDDNDEDEDEEESKSKKKSSIRKKSGRAQVGDGQQGERPPECKQQ